MVGGLVKKRMELQDFLKEPKPLRLMMMIKVSVFTFCNICQSESSTLQERFTGKNIHKVVP